MKKTILFSLFILCFSYTLSAQEEENDAPEQGWSTGGKFQILFNQSAFNEAWTGGGTSNIAANLILDYDINYRKGDFTWDNKILANYGLTRTSGEDFPRKTSDRLELNSIVGKQLPDSNWYYTFFLNFKTQFSKGYEYSEDPDTGVVTRTATTEVLSPGYLQAGPGMMWKEDENLFVNIAPATGRLILVNPNFTRKPEYVDGEYFGIDRGEATRFEFGASLNAYAKYKLLQNVTMEHNLSLYSNYLDSPGNVDIDYLLNINMSINEFLSTNLIFQAIYDDNAVAAFQIREVFGLSFNVSL